MLKTIIRQLYIFLLLFTYTIPVVFDEPEQEFLTSEMCLKANIYFEARGETKEGMKAVAAVTMNRAKHRNYPDSVCKVVWQHKQFSWTHQIAKDIQYKVLVGDVEYLGSLKKVDLEKYKQSELIAGLALIDDKSIARILPAGTIFYHALHVKPTWSSKFKKVKQIGKHLFYKG